jgi:hypothetical protein
VTRVVARFSLLLAAIVGPWRGQAAVFFSQESSIVVSVISSVYKKSSDWGWGCQNNDHQQIFN